MTGPSAQHLVDSTNAGTDETTFTLDGRVATVHLNRPERRNSFTSAFMESLLHSVEQAVASGAPVIVILGGERGFSVGGDLDEFSAGKFAPADQTPEQSAAVLRRHARAVEMLRASEQVSIAAVSGPCAGAGFSLAAACDLRIAADTAVFRTAFIDAGLASDYGGIWSLTKLLGEARAKELMFLNPKVTAARALEIGLISQLAPSEDFAATVHEVATALAAKAPRALATTKQLFAAQADDFGAALDAESLAQKQCAYTADAREAALAFTERRMPVFSNA